MAFAQSARMVGRDKERGSLRAAWSRARSGRPAVVLVEGEAGIGKTRLVREFADEVAAETAGPVTPVVATGHGVDLAAGAVPYGAAASLLQDLVLEVGSEAAADVLGPHVEVLAGLVPALGSGAGGELDRLALFGATRLLLGELSRERLMVLFVEDLHWADTASIDLLISVATGVRRGRILLVLTTRPLPLGGASQNSLAEQVAAIARLGQTDLLRLTPLSSDEVAEQVADLLSPDSGASAGRVALLERVAELSEGVPLYVEELVSAAADGGRAGAAAIPRLNLAGRLSGIDATSLTVLETFALEERPVTIPLLAEVTGSTLDQVAAALDVAAAHGLVDALAQGRYRFHHVLLRQAVADSSQASARIRRHQRWAEVLAASHGADRADAVVAIADHWWQSGPSPAALAASKRAAELAQHYGAAKEARSHWLRVLSLMGHVPGAATEEERDEVLFRLTNRIDASHEEALEVLLAEERRVPSPTGVRSTWLRCGLLVARYRTTGVPHRPAESEMRDALERLRRAEPSVMVFAAEDALVQYTYWAGYPRPLVREAIAETERTTKALDRPLLTMMLLDWQALMAWNDGKEEYRAYSDQLVLMSAGGDRQRHIYYRLVAAAAALEAGDIESAMTQAQGTLDQMDEPSLERYYWPLATIVGRAHAYRGDWDEAADVFARSTGQHTMARGQDHVFATWIALRRGERVLAQTYLDRVKTVPVTDPREAADFAADLVAAEVAAFDGDFAGACEILRPVLQAERLHEASDCTWQPVLAAARHTGQLSGADPDWVRLVRAAGDRVFKFGRLGRAWAAELDAHLARAEGSGTARLWRTAADAWGEVGAVFEQVECRVHAAEALLADGEKEAAAGEMAAALGIADRLRATPLADHIHALAGRARVALRGQRAPAGSAGPLTGRELEVLRLVAAGRTNQQIGETLFMSPKTASVHVSRIIDKLGAANRTEVVSVAHRRGLLDA